MLALPPGAKLYFYTGIADMRKGYNGLSGLVRGELERDPTDGSIYCFVNKRRDQLVSGSPRPHLLDKLLCFEPDGYAVYYKVLAQGTLEIPKPEAGGTHATITAQTLQLILGGIKLEHVRRRKRYQKAA